MLEMALTLSQMTKFRLLQTESIRRHFKFNENGRIENTVGKGEIAR